MTRLIKTKRRTRAEIEAAKEAVYSMLSVDNPMTLRQLFYRLVSNGTIGKKETEYSSLANLTKNMRMNGELPFEWFADNTRWQRNPRSYSSLERGVEIFAEAYRRDIWNSQTNYVEIWLEKDALAGVVYDVTAEFDVPLMVSRGYSSLSYLHGGAMQIEAIDKPTYIYYFGDYDPSGRDIPRDIETKLRTFAPDADINFQIVGVTPKQIEILKLQTRPTKKTDSRSKNFEGESVEVDAIPPGILRSMVRQVIERNINKHQLEQAKLIEQEEREIITRVARTFR
ncbi:MAG TPA: hypothetical protein PKE69_10225 [Pyrinomonadaceae bacterium]|nr:hypothetical protein [Pyrinomonadaceae bacterium]